MRFSITGLPVLIMWQPALLECGRPADAGSKREAGDLVYSGSARPKFTYGLTNTFRYGNVDLAFMLISKTGLPNTPVGISGSKTICRKMLPNAGEIRPSEKSAAFIPSLSTGTEVVVYRNSDVFMESGNFR